MTLFDFLKWILEDTWRFIICFVLGAGIVAGICDIIGAFKGKHD